MTIPIKPPSKREQPQLLDKDHPRRAEGKLKHGQHKARGPPEESMAYSVDSFCAAHNISRAYFYILCQRGEGPAVMKLGRRVLISKEAAAAWRAKWTAKAITAA
jgi:hypothetical protein